MPKHLIKRLTPDHEMIRNHRHLQCFGKLLHDANLWHLNRRSAAGAFAVGLFMAFIPVPFQMILAAGAAILFRVNLPLSVALVWVTNPITIPPIF
ncbi:ATP-binding protein, partial [Candidatus Endoriftia persephone str. Guaymas]|nr:ATP-binding protein [Candidatus Endoriftia persephone str. Guaymas]